jgi:hypothetical protein
MLTADQIRHYCDLLRFFITQRLSGFDIPEAPHFDQESLPLFMSVIRNCRFYIEYGSGGSTIVAARLDKRFISVDTDRFFLKSVRKKIGAISPHQRLVHADIGLTGQWGVPLRIKRLKPQRLRKWTDYPETPWRLIPAGLFPDVVLVDGRFRVSTALTCCAHLVASAGARILVDDYADRPHYHVIEKHAILTATAGRMAIFQPSPEDVRKLKETIAQYASDWR